MPGGADSPSTGTTSKQPSRRDGSGVAPQPRRVRAEAPRGRPQQQRRGRRALEGGSRRRGLPSPRSFPGGTRALGRSQRPGPDRQPDPSRRLPLRTAPSRGHRHRRSPRRPWLSSARGPSGAERWGAERCGRTGPAAPAAGAGRAPPAPALPLRPAAWPAASHAVEAGTGAPAAGSACGRTSCPAALLSRSPAARERRGVTGEPPLPSASAERRLHQALAVGDEPSNPALREPLRSAAVPRSAPRLEGEAKTKRKCP